ncbi:hypothetical protein Dxin01_04041 [Deinococcus xinjiangensis]|uniref:C2H2-type domain-containing protein n=1 Tax=Deinococcus xinjiangensis TaxID=457454 RepID=A0ABP9VGC5_9DEIO
MTPRNLPLIGTGYNPSAWCPNCHKPFAAHLNDCPHCTYPHRPEWLRRVERLVGVWAYRAACALGGDE